MTELRKGYPVFSPDGTHMTYGATKGDKQFAAIGPATRDGRKPSGRTVPGEADHQLGRMCDTYGLFAVPGLERKVSPVSGLLVNVMFWTVAVRIAEEILARTGNAPGVLSTGAVVGGAEQGARKLELVKTRGY